MPVTDAERLAAIAAVEASSHIPDPEGDVDFWVGYRLPENSDPSSETNYDGENGQTMEQVVLAVVLELRQLRHQKGLQPLRAPQDSGRRDTGLLHETRSGPYPGVCQLGVRPPPPPALQLRLSSEPTKSARRRLAQQHL